MRANRFLKAMLMGFFVLAMAAGCRTGSGPPPRVSNLLDDKTTSERVKQALFDVSSNSFAAVQVTATNSVVTLRGAVPTPQARERAGQIALRLERVKQVRNEITIGMPPAE